MSLGSPPRTACRMAEWGFVIGAIISTALTIIVITLKTGRDVRRELHRVEDRLLEELHKLDVDIDRVDREVSKIVAVVDSLRSEIEELEKRVSDIEKRLSEIAARLEVRRVEAELTVLREVLMRTLREAMCRG